MIRKILNWLFGKKEIVDYSIDFDEPVRFQPNTVEPIVQTPLPPSEETTTFDPSKLIDYVDYNNSSTDEVVVPLDDEKDIPDFEPEKTPKKEKKPRKPRKPRKKKEKKPAEPIVKDPVSSGVKFVMEKPKKAD